MDVFSIEITNVRAALQRDRALTFSRSKLRPLARVFGWMNRSALTGRGRLPPGFRGTMGEDDERLPQMEHGLGVMVDGTRRFYPRDAIGAGIVDELEGRSLHVRIGAADQIPFAEWEQDGSRPLQLFTRWYGFAYTFPGCEIHHEEPAARN